MVTLINIASFVECVLYITVCISCVKFLSLLTEYFCCMEWRAILAWSAIFASFNNVLFLISCSLEH